MTDKQKSEVRATAAALETLDMGGVADFVRRLHVELETLHAKLKTHEDLGDAGSDVQLLRMGYAAARLEVESLKAQLAERASHGQAPAQATPACLTCNDHGAVGNILTAEPCPDCTRKAAPAAVTGPSGYGPKVTVKRRCSDCKACNSESYAVQGDSGHYVYCEHPSLPERKYIGDTRWDTPGWCPAAAPTTQPAPKQDPSQTAVQLAELVLSDCGHSSRYAPLLNRVTARINAHVERRLDELRGCLESRPSPASQGGK